MSAPFVILSMHLTMHPITYLNHTIALPRRIHQHEIAPHAHNTFYRLLPFEDGMFEAHDVSDVHVSSPSVAFADENPHPEAVDSGEHGDSVGGVAGEAIIYESVGGEEGEDCGEDDFGDAGWRVNWRWCCGRDFGFRRCKSCELPWPIVIEPDAYAEEAVPLLHRSTSNDVQYGVQSRPEAFTALACCIEIRV